MKKKTRKAAGRGRSVKADPGKDASSDIAMIADEVKRKSEERRGRDFSAQRTPEFLTSIERATAMGKRDNVTAAIRNMFIGTEVSLDQVFGDILPRLQEAVSEMLGDDSVWAYVKFNGSFPKKGPNVMGSKVTRGGGTLDGATDAIMASIEAQAQAAGDEASEAYSRAVDAIIEDLRIRLLRKIGCIKVVADVDAPTAVPIEV